MVSMIFLHNKKNSPVSVVNDSELGKLSSSTDASAAVISAAGGEVGSKGIRSKRELLATGKKPRISNHAFVEAQKLALNVG